MSTFFNLVEVPLGFLFLGGGGGVMTGAGFGSDNLTAAGLRRDLWGAGVKQSITF